MRRCRECGRPIVAERRRHGRGSVRELWWVHTNTDRVSCEAADRDAHREVLREAGVWRTGGTGGTVHDTPTHPVPRSISRNPLETSVPSVPSTPVCPVFTGVSASVVRCHLRSRTVPSGTVPDLVGSYFL
mgnify:CR=1 FL=1